MISIAESLAMFRTWDLINSQELETEANAYVVSKCMISRQVGLGHETD